MTLRYFLSRPLNAVIATTLALLLGTFATGCARFQKTQQPALAPQTSSLASGTRRRAVVSVTQKRRWLRRGKSTAHMTLEIKPTGLICHGEVEVDQSKYRDCSNYSGLALYSISQLGIPVQCADGQTLQLAPSSDSCHSLTGYLIDDADRRIRYVAQLRVDRNVASTTQPTTFKNTQAARKTKQKRRWSLKTLWRKRQRDKTVTSIESDIPTGTATEATHQLPATTAIQAAQSLTHQPASVKTLDDEPFVPSPKMGQSTAFMVGPGLLATNNHFIKKTDAIWVYDHNRERLVQATVVAQDTDNDLALLSVDIKGPVLPLANSDTVRKGHEVVVLGYPSIGQLGQDTHSTLGHISTLHDDEHGFFHFDAPIQRGDMGGPVLNRAGQVIGVVSSDVHHSTEHGNICHFATKSDHLANMLKASASFDTPMTASSVPTPSLYVELADVIEAVDPHIYIVLTAPPTPAGSLK